MITSMTNCSSRPTFRGLIPKSQYNGIILKLTKQEKSKIAEYEKEIANLELEHIKLADFYAKNEHNNSIQEYCSQKMVKLEHFMATLKDMIREIKTSRLNTQKLMESKKNRHQT